MNMNQFTQKTIEAMQRAQQIAVEYGHQYVDQEHVLLSLTEDGAALIPQLLGKCGLSADLTRAALTEAEKELIASLKESFIRIDKGEVFIYGMHVSPYEKGNIFNKDPLQ